MDLRELLDLYQADHCDYWEQLPGGGPANRFLTGVIDVASSDERPALAAFQGSYRAVYTPDVRIGLAWGFDEKDWQDREPDTGSPIPTHSPEWASSGWSGTEPHFAVALFNGQPVWQAVYAYVNWGAGIDGILPWPSAEFEDRKLGEAPDIAAWVTTRWEVEFARLLNEIQGNNDFLFDAELEGTGMVARDAVPINSHALSVS